MGETDFQYTHISPLGRKDGGGNTPMHMLDSHKRPVSVSTAGFDLFVWGENCRDNGLQSVVHTFFEGMDKLMR